MSVLIKGMEMPKNCDSCPFFDDIYTRMDDDDMYYCNLAGGLTYWQYAGETEKDCPLVEVPPHGDLIDRGAFLAEKRHLYCENCERRKGMKNGKMKFVYDIGDAPCRACGYGDVLDNIEDAPTIIEAEEGE